jgi:hypothetical protein
MANKTFADFSTLAKSTNDLQNKDYLVGYRPYTYGNDEIKISAYDFANSLNLLLENGAIEADQIHFEGNGATAVTTVADKLKQFIDYADYTDATVSAYNAYDKRFFIPKGITITINLTDVNNTNLSLPSILSKITSWHIDGTVKINLGHGQWNIYESVILNHSYGQNIQIIGDTSYPNLVKLQMIGSSFDILKCTNGCTFGLIDGITIIGVGNQISYAGIAAYGGALINVGTSVIIQGCVYGIKADQGAIVLANGVTVNGPSGLNRTDGNGFYALNRSHISALSATAFNNINGYKAENHSQINAEYSTGSNNLKNGYFAGSNSEIAASYTFSNYNSGSGFYAQSNGTIECYNAVAVNNIRYGIEFDSGGNINGGFNLPINAYTSLSAWNNQSSVSSNVGKLYVKTPDNSSVLFNTNNNLTQFEVSNTNNAISHIVVNGGNNVGHSSISVVNANASGDAVGLKIDAGTNLSGQAKYLDLGSKIRFSNFIANVIDLGNGNISSGYITCQDLNGNLCKLLVLK